MKVNMYSYSRNIQVSQANEYFAAKRILEVRLREKGRQSNPVSTLQLELQSAKTSGNTCVGDTPSRCMFH